MDDKKKEVRNAWFDLTTPDGMQKFFLGTKKNGQPRAVYDVVKFYTNPKKSKKKGKKHDDESASMYSFYLNTKGGKKKKKKHKKDHWHI